MTPNQAKGKIKRNVESLEKIADNLSSICEEFDDDVLCEKLGSLIDRIDEMIDGDDSISDVLDYIDQELVEKKDNEDEE